jgi:hypothetical protein
MHGRTRHPNRAVRSKYDMATMGLFHVAHPAEATIGPSLAPWRSAYFVTASGSYPLHLFLYRHVFLIRRREASAQGCRGCHPEDLKHFCHPIVPLRTSPQGPALCHHRCSICWWSISSLGFDSIFKVCQTAPDSFSQRLAASGPVS